MNKKYISYTQYNQTIKRFNMVHKLGIIPCYKKNYYKISLGFVCLAIALFPNGLGLVFYPLSFMLLGFSMWDIKNIYLPKFMRFLK